MDIRLKAIPVQRNLYVRSVRRKWRRSRGLPASSKWLCLMGRNECAEKGDTVTVVAHFLASGKLGLSLSEHCGSIETYSHRRTDWQCCDWQSSWQMCAGVLHRHSVIQGRAPGEREGRQALKKEWKKRGESPVGDMLIMSCGCVNKLVSERHLLFTSAVSFRFTRLLGAPIRRASVCPLSSIAVSTHVCLCVPVPAALNLFLVCGPRARQLFRATTVVALLYSRPRR